MELPSTSSAFTSDPSTYNKEALTSQPDSSVAKVEVMVVCRFKFPSSLSMASIQLWLEENIALGEDDTFTITGVEVIEGSDRDTGR